MSEKPKILYLINSLVIGGAEVGLANMVSRGVFDDFDLSVLTIWGGAEDFLSWKECLRGVYIGSLMSSEGGGASRAWSVVSNLYKVVKKERPRVIIASLPQSVLLARLCRVLFPAVKVITFEHNERLGSHFATAMFRLSSWTSSAVWSDSAVTTESVIRRHWYRPGTPSYVVSLQDLNDCLSAPMPNHSTQELKLIFVGRLTPQKNVVATVEGVRLARRRGVPVTLDIVGDGELMAEVDGIVRAAGLSDWVRIHGAKVDWPHLFGGGGFIGILASHREGLSITGLQLLALGFPLVSTGSGEVGRYLEDGVNGIRVPDGSAESIADALDLAWSVRERFPEMSRAARQSAVAFDASIGTPERDARAKLMLRALAT